MLRFLARFLAVILATLLVFTTVAVVGLHAVASRVLQPQAWRDVWRGEKISTRLPEATADMLTRAFASLQKGVEKPAVRADDFEGWIASFTRDDLTTMTAAALPPDYLDAQFDGVVAQGFAFLHSDAARPSVVLTFAELKQRLAGGALADAYLRVLETKPPCPAGATAAQQGPFPSTCRPPANEIPALHAKFTEFTAQFAKEIPDRHELFAAGDSRQAEVFYNSLAEIRTRVRTLETIHRWSWIAPALLLLGIALFGVRSFRGLLLWWGIPLLLAGGFIALCSLPGAALANAAFNTILAPQLPPEAPVEVVKLILGFITAVISGMQSVGLKLGGGLALGSLLALIVAAFCKKRTPPPLATPPPYVAAPTSPPAI